MSAASRRARARAASGRRAGLVSRLLVTGIDFVVVTALLFGIFFSISVAQYLVGGDVIKLPHTGPVSSSFAFFAQMSLPEYTTFVRSSSSFSGCERSS